jgi:hypothetical protein
MTGPKSRFCVVSGGQTGVDRAALDAASAAGMATGGWCPHGRLAENGFIPPHYPLRETPSASYAQRTTWNVRDSDGTLILFDDTLERGTAFTAEEAVREDRPSLLVKLSSTPEPAQVISWIKYHTIWTLNVAGPRETESPGIYARARPYLDDLFRRLSAPENLGHR